MSNEQEDLLMELETGPVVVAAQQAALLSPVNLAEAPVKVVL